MFLYFSQWPTCVYTSVYIFSRRCVYFLMALSDTKLRKLLGKEQDFRILTHRDGLRIRVTTKGVLTWQYRYRFDGKQVILSLGRYPGMSIKEAQSHIPDFQNWLAQGRDPRIEYKIVQSHQSELPRLDELARQWLEIKVPDLKEKTRILYKNHAEKWIYPYFNEKSLPVDDMRLLDWVAYFDKVKEKGSAKTAAVMLVRIKTIVRWAYKRGALHNQCPVLNLNTNDVGEAAAKGQRVLSLSELAQLWVCIERSKAAPATKYCLQLIFLTGARQSEVRTAKWEDFNLIDGVWTVPAENSKTNKPIRRPITDKMKELLEHLAIAYGRSGYIVPGSSPRKPITSHAINRYCARMWGTMNKEHGTPQFVPHDARRSVSTILSEHKVLPHVTEKMLGHSMRGVMAIYNKHDWIKEQRAGYDLYWALICSNIERFDGNGCL